MASTEVKTDTACQYHSPTFGLRRVDCTYHSEYSLFKACITFGIGELFPRRNPNGLGIFVCRLLIIVKVVLLMDCKYQSWLTNFPRWNSCPFLIALLNQEKRPVVWSMTVLPMSKRSYRIQVQHNI